MQQLGKVIDKVQLGIDYHIIEHFSKHLYSSPNKAIEELVVNGYDAGAHVVRAFLPGEFTKNLIVWDDGVSMDTNGLKSLWKVADSPKNSDENRLISLTGGEQRKVIGKFGIGKIASYTIGSQIFHICKSNQVFLSVGVDYDKLINNGSSDANIELQSADIFELTEEEAKTLLISVFETLPADFDGFFTKPSWTCAVIDQLKLNDLPIGRLKWVLGNGMPLKPQFSVYVNDVKIESNILKNDLACEWSFGQKEVVDQLTSKWNVAIERGEVKGEIKFGEEVGLDPDNINESIAYVELPNLNKVWGKIRLYKKSLLENRVNDYGRSHGFFIMVLGRLINQDDAQFFLNDPSFATFYSSQYILNVDGLDSDLLADRERVQETSIKSKELKVVQRAVYLALAAKQRKDVELMIDSQQIKHRLPVNSSEFFMQPLSALWIKSGSGETLGFDFKDPKIESVPLGAKSYVSAFSAKDGFTVNSDHPYYQNLTHLLGNSKQAQKVVKEFEVIAVSEKLFEGYLFELGIDEVSTGKIMFWRDEMYRKIAHSDNQTVYQLAQTLRETSYKTGAVFENAIVDILNSIGLIDYIDVAPGQ